MAQISVESFKNFFKYYGGEDHQQLAVEDLYKLIPLDALENNCEWMLQYRDQLKDQAEETKQWPITKVQMGLIMNCSTESLPDSLMDLSLIHISGAHET